MKPARTAFAILALLLMTASMIQLRAQAQVRQLHINKAIYGKNGQGVDVTNTLRGKIQNNSLDVKVNNKNMGADPNVGADKSVKVEYTYQGRTMTSLSRKAIACSFRS